MNAKLPPEFSEKNALIGEIVNGPRRSAMYENAYICTFRPSGQSKSPLRGGIPAYLVLASEEVVSIIITGVLMVHPTPATVHSGTWQPEDTTVLFRAPDLTEEQVKQARIFVLP